MADTSLTRDQAVALLQRLGQDEKFRELFASKPAEALHDLGVDAQTVVRLPAYCICPKPLAPAQVYAQMAAELNDEALTGTMQMQVPKA
jgi:putative modified peptide